MIDIRKISPSTKSSIFLPSKTSDPFMSVKPLFYYDANSLTSFPGSGSSVFDLSGDSRNATIYNSVTTSSLPSGFKFFSFNGSNQYLQLASQDFGSFSSGLTIIAFANFGSAGSWERLIDFGSGSSASNIGFSREGTSASLVHFQYNGSTVAFQTSVANYIVDNSWRMYAVVANGATIKYWSNLSTTSLSSSSVPVQTTRTLNYIARSNWADAYFDTGIGQIAMWNKALSDSDISSIYTAHASRYGIA